MMNDELSALEKFLVAHRPGCKFGNQSSGGVSLLDWKKCTCGRDEAAIKYHGEFAKLNFE